ncbi:MAG: alanine--tRNA ligase, partial [Bacteroidia bacterium]|nr:alanine--tRNA ligase [Bacteroidia bacterium]
DDSEGLPKDLEAANEWEKFVPKDRILFFSKKDNFWEMGDTGPCGPCTEIHMDLRTDEERSTINGASLVNQGTQEVVEIWNIVFIQFNRKSDGSLEELKMKSVDTGMGFERLCMALQGKRSTYDTDIFKPLKDFLEQNYHCNYERGGMEQVAMRVVMDHIRAITFTIADGQLPSNTGAGYVIRRILRRASRYAFRYLNIKTPFLFQLVPVLSAQFKGVFDEISAQQAFIQKIIETEETSFLKKLEQGIKRFEEYVSKQPDKPIIDGKFAFELYDTFGFPYDLTVLMAQEIQWRVDEVGFQTYMLEQKSRSKAATKAEFGDWTELSDQETTFVGYDYTKLQTEITKYRAVKTKNNTIYQVMLNRTPFYAESGGQVGDTGYLTNSTETIQVIDTIKENESIIHIVNTLPKQVEGEWIAQVNTERRNLIRANHSATHLLHAALRLVLGNHVEQRGSLVNADYLRFDFSHFQKVSDDEIEQIEKIVNSKIQAAIPLEEFRSIPIQEAKAMGAMALFGEKYGETVRVIRFGADYSTELCGGTHVNNTSDIRLFKIVSESSIAAGIRRIEAVTSVGAISYLENRSKLLNKLLEILKYPQQPEKFLTEWIQKHKDLETKVEKFRHQQVLRLRDELLLKTSPAHNFSIIQAIVELESADDLKQLSFELRKTSKQTVICLGANLDGKPMLSFILSEDLQPTDSLNMTNLVRDAAKAIQGGGGGQPFYATAGGKKVDGLTDALQIAIKQLTS